MESVSRIRYRMKTVVIGLLFVAAGLVLLVVSLNLQERSFLASLLRELTTLFVIGGALNVAYEVFQRQDFVESNDENTRQILSQVDEVRNELVERLTISQQADALGLVETKTDANTVDYGDLIENSDTLTIVVTDGRTWVANHSPRLRRRFADPGRTTRIVVVHPDSPMISVIARKEGSYVKALQHKISETIRTLDQLCTPTTNLSVLGHFLFNPHSVFLGDQYAIVSSYFHGRGRRTVPAFKYEKREGECFFKDLESDIESLLLDAEDIRGFADFRVDELVPELSQDYQARGG